MSQIYLLYPQMYPKGFMYLWSATSPRCSKASIPDLNHSVPICYSSTLSPFLVTNGGCTAWAFLLPCHGHFYFCSLTLCTQRKKALSLWTEANPPFYALELILCLCYVSLFGWWFILSCILIFSLIYLSSTVYQYTESISPLVREKIRSEGIFPLLKNSNLLSVTSKRLLQTVFSTSLPIFLFSRLCYAFSLSCSTRAALENDLLFANFKWLSSVLSSLIPLQLWMLWKCLLETTTSFGTTDSSFPCFPSSSDFFSYLK